jgi:HK97 family phage prohead protease
MENKMENKSQIVRRSFSTPTELHVRETEGADSRTITGYAIMFGVPSAPLWKEENSEAREVIAPGAITKELLDGQDIKMTMFHDRQLLLARSNKGEGTLKYTVDEKGVAFEFDAPNTIDGDKALELVRRGDISGCSFAFSTPYYDEDYVERKSEVDANGFDEITYIVKAVTGIYDFTLAIDPAYEDTSVEAREFVRTLKGVQAEEAPAEDKKDEAKMLEQIREMRRIANDSLVR